MQPGYNGSLFNEIILGAALLQTFHNKEMMKRMEKENRIWDIFVRVFHWSLVIFFSVAYISGDDGSTIHVYSGYVVLGLISARVIWGLVGTKYARFSNFVCNKARVITYLKSLLTGKPEYYPGHNPAAGWMVIALIVSLFLTTLSGLQLYAVEQGLGPFANNFPEVQIISTAIADSNEHGDSGGFWSGFWEAIHEAFANFTLLLVLIHISGVLLSSLLHRENLIKAMITGNKREKH